MDLNELMEYANAGNTEAMVEAAKICVQQNDYNGGIEWADKAAAAGDVSGCFWGILVHKIRMLRSKDMGLWSLMEEDCQKIQDYAGTIFDESDSGKITLSEQQMDIICDAVNKAVYCEALYEYVTNTDSPNNARIIELLECQWQSSNEACVLYGESCFNAKHYSEAFAALSRIANNDEYCKRQKDTAEEVLYSCAMYSLAEMYRGGINGVVTQDMSVAIEVLNTAIRGIYHEETRQGIRNELSRYKKTLFGGWKYQ